MSKTLQAHLALLTANIIYGANYSIAKVVMPEHIRPAGFILLRVIGAMVLFWFVSATIVKEEAEKKDIRFFAILGLFGVAINQMLFFKGLNLTSPINASIMMVSNPILVTVAASLILKEKITLSRISGILIGFAGAAALLLSGQSGSTESHWTGDLMILLNSMSWGIYLVLVKPYMKKYNTVTIVKWCFLFGFIYVLPFSWEELAEVHWAAITPTIWLCITFVVVGSTFLAYLLNTYALRALSPSVVSAYIYLQPFLASSIALAFGKDEITSAKLIAAAFIFLGVYLVSRPAPLNK